MAVASAGCAPPDEPDRLGAGIPRAAMELLRPDTVRSAELHHGVWYSYLWSPRGPWAVHLVQAHLDDRCDVGLDVVRPLARVEGGLGRERVSEMAARLAARPLAVVNADFFTPEGAPVGAEVVGGVVTSRAERPTFAWRRGSDPWMGTARQEGRALRFGWAEAAPGAEGEADGSTSTVEAVGGFPDLIDGGRRVGDLEVEARPAFAAARHPRTAVGWDGDSGRLWLVVVDGRQAPHSVGMTLPELAGLFEALETEEALNLDGGGSTTLVVEGRTMNRPSDATGERPVANALALVRTPDACRSLSSPR